MYQKIDGGTIINIQGLNCCLPPEGYVFNIVSQQLEYRGVYSRSDNPNEQYWERLKMPSWYKEVIKKEVDYLKTKKEEDPPFFDKRYEEFKKVEWDRRFNGFWFMNKGKAVYLTGFYYMLLQWFNIDIGYAKFIIPHLYKTYFLQYCIEDPLCMGMIDITKRRFLKTFIGGLFILEYVTRTKMVNGAIQSKKGNDAKKVFSKAVVSPFRKFPKFFRPEYDMSLGINPKTEIRFQQTNVRGKKAEDGIDKDELGSMIDWGSADAIDYDGTKLHRYFGDEWGKTVEANIFDRHEVIRYCLLDEEGKIIGKALYSTTVEKLESDKDGVQKAAKELWDASNQDKRGENGMTQSGLYRFFQTSDEGRNFDIYGFPNVEQTIKDILSEREAVKNNLRSLAARMRKEPRTIDEAFLTDQDKCIFNILNIGKREKELLANPIYKRPILFYRDIDQSVRWRDVKEVEGGFYWRITYLPPNNECNKFYYENGIRKPSRIKDGVISIDGYSNSQGGKFGSKASAWIGRMFDIKDPDNTGKAIGHLYGRPAIKEDLHQQIMLACEYYGYKAWYEHNSDDYLSYFRERGRIGYLGKYPLTSIEPSKRNDAERYYGFPTTPFSLTKQADTGIAYFENYCHLIDFEEVLIEAKEFDPNNRTEFDTVVSFLMMLVCILEPSNIPPKRKIPLVKIYESQSFG